MGEKPVFDLVKKKNDFEKIVACLVLKLMRRSGIQTAMQMLFLIKMSMILPKLYMKQVSMRCLTVLCSSHTP